MSAADQFWQAVPLTEFSLPVSPVKVEAERRLSGLRRLFKLPTELPEPAQTQQQLSAINNEDISRLAPAFCLVMISQLVYRQYLFLPHSGYSVPLLSV